MNVVDNQALRGLQRECGAGGREQTATAVESSLAVCALLNDLDIQVSALREALGILENKLEPALVPRVPEPTPGGARGGEEVIRCCPVSCALLEQLRRVADLREGVLELAGRVAL